jgi:hypothetical protein
MALTKIGLDCFNTNGAAHGLVANQIANSRFNVGRMRPFVGNDGNSYVSLFQGYKTDPKTGNFTTNEKGEKQKQYKTFATNADSLLKRDEWIQIDKAVREVAVNELRLVKDLVDKGLTYDIPNGLGKTVMEWQRMSRAGKAQMSMDGLQRGESDRPVYDLVGMPLPILFAEFHISMRELEASRNSGAGVDTDMIKQDMRQLNEELEKMVVGVSTLTLPFGGYSIYGYKNHPSRETYTLTAPTAGGWTGGTLVTQLIAMRQLLYNNNQMGPYTIYLAPNWMPYLDEDFSATKNSNTLRQRITAIDLFPTVRIANYLSNYDIIMVDMKEQTVRLVTGLNWTTIQYKSLDEMEAGFKIIGIKVPQIRADYEGQIGLVHGSV